MPPPLPPPAEAGVGMRAAATMAAAVATAKIVLRIMGRSWLLLDVLSPHPARQSGEPAVGFNGADKPGRCARPMFFARSSAAGAVAQGCRCITRAVVRLAALAHPRYKPPRSTLLRFPP